MRRAKTRTRSCRVQRTPRVRNILTVTCGTTSCILRGVLTTRCCSPSGGTTTVGGMARCNWFHITELCLSAAPIAHPTQPLTMLITFARAALTRWTCKVRTEFKRAKQPHTRSRPHSPSGEQWPQPPRLWVYASNALITSSSTEPGARRRRRRACVLPSRTLFLRWPLVHSTSTDLACAPSACAVHLCPGRRVPHRATQHLVCCACHRGLHPV